MKFLSNLIRRNRERRSRILAERIVKTTQEISDLRVRLMVTCAMGTSAVNQKERFVADILCDMAEDGQAALTKLERKLCLLEQKAGENIARLNA